MKLYYFDRQGQGITLEDWSKKFSDWDYKVLSSTVLPSGVWVATIWVGHDLLASFDGTPHIFETTVFREKPNPEGPHVRLRALHQRTYATEEDALVGHAALVKEWSEKAV